MKMKKKTPKISKNKYLKQLFFRWWMFKYVIFSYDVKYDFLWAGLINLAPFKKDIYKNNKKLFCSEFISNAFLYAGFYPFDYITKSSLMISPGDLMDIWDIFWKKEYEVIWKDFNFIVDSNETKEKFYKILTNKN